MPKKISLQTASGKAVYRLRQDLRVPTSDEKGHFRWLPTGSEASEDELQGLVLPALVQGGFIEKIKEASVLCEACQEQGNAAEKKKRFSAQELVEHYREKHPALAPPEEV